jgi:hypothetical protein
VSSVGDQPVSSPRPVAVGGVALKVLVLISSLVMAGSFAAPWYRAKITPFFPKPDNATEKVMQAEGKDQKAEIKEKQSFIDKYRIREKDEKARKAFRDKYDVALGISIRDANGELSPAYKATEGKSYTIFVWGWECAQGILSLVFGLLVAGYSIVGMVVGALRRRWGWIGSFACTGLGLPIAIVAALWWANCPGKDVTGRLTQGAFVGAFMALGGAALVFVFALVDAITGLARIVRGRTVPPPGL